MHGTKGKVRPMIVDEHGKMRASHLSKRMRLRIGAPSLLRAYTAPYTNFNGWACNFLAGAWIRALLETVKSVRSPPAEGGGTSVRLQRLHNPAWGAAMSALVCTP